MIPTDTNLVWIDLEMTGLNPVYDVILEVAVIITDGDLTIIDEGFSSVIYQQDDLLLGMNSYVHQLHTASGLLEAVRASRDTLSQVEERCLQLIDAYCTKNTGILAGNSVWQDRLFLQRYMPRITDYLHYRMLDVTAFKVAIERWYPQEVNREYKKRNIHRAMSDILESIEELRHYRTNFFVHATSCRESK